MISSWLILTPWCFCHMICAMFAGIWWIINLCSDCDWYLLWSIWDWSWVVLHLYFVNLLFKILPACSCRLSVALYHVGHVICWTPRGIYLARWLHSCLPMTSLNDRNMSLRNIALPPWRTQWRLWPCVTLIYYFMHFLIQSFVALSLWLCRGSQLNTEVMLDSPLRCGWLVSRCWWINDLHYFVVLPTQLN